jgi:hypothetical protein
MKKILDIVNNVTYKHANFNMKFFILQATQKWQNPIRFKYMLRSTQLLFLCSQIYKVFKIDILHICGINIVYIQKKIHVFSWNS